jgi:hypothetical protein
MSEKLQDFLAFGVLSRDSRITVRLQTKLTFDVVNLHEPIPRTRSSKVEKSLESGLALLISINDTPFLKAQLYPTFSR